MARLALYGNVGIVRAYCQDCQRMSLVIKGIRQCCDKPLSEDETVEGSERIIEPEAKRRDLPRWKREQILREQNFRCFYCDRRIGSSVWYKGHQITLRVHFDHVLPYSYSYNNDASNFVAACHVCNNWKSRMVFNSLEEIQVYVTEKWQRVETDVGKNLPGMRDGISE